MTDGRNIVSERMELVSIQVQFLLFGRIRPAVPCACFAGKLGGVKFLRSFIPELSHEAAKLPGNGLK
jgi:hypothetical protein